MKTALIFLVCPFLYGAAQEKSVVKEVYRYDQYGIREPLPAQIIKETPFKAEIYNTNYGIPETTPTYEIIKTDMQQLYQGLEIYTPPVEIPVPDNFEYLGNGLDN